MEKFEVGRGSPECNGSYIQARMGFVSDSQNESARLLKLDSKLASKLQEGILLERVHLDSPGEILEYFEDVRLQSADPIFRPKGDTTFFTTAGVQKIETILREKGELLPDTFAVAQPVIRSQFMDKVKDGVSTAFVNFSIEDIHSNPEKYLELSQQLVRLILNQGIDTSDLRFTVEDTVDRWGSRKFKKSVLTIFVNSVEVAECVYIPDYPVTENKKVAISDICFGYERLRWALTDDSSYIPGFEDFYLQREKDVSSDMVTSTLDCVRTACLMVGAGVTSSHKDPGFRFRQLMKRFVVRNRASKLDLQRAVEISYEYWNKWGAEQVVPLEGVLETVRAETDRSYNVLFLSALESEVNQQFYVNVNQSSVDFLNQVRLSLPKEMAESIEQVVKKLT